MMSNGWQLPSRAPDMICGSREETLQVAIVLLCAVSDHNCYIVGDSLTVVWTEFRELR